MSSVSIPVTVQLASAPASANRASPKADSGCAPPDPCKGVIPFYVGYDYLCGNHPNVQERSGSAQLMCVAKGVKDCLKAAAGTAKSMNVATLGCGAIDEFLKCSGVNLDPCVKAPIDAACGAAAGAGEGLSGLAALAGAAFGAGGDAAQCGCKYLPNLPLPPRPSSSSGGGGPPVLLLPNLPGGGGGVAALSATATGISLSPNCGGTMQAANVVRRVVGRANPAKYQPPAVPRNGEQGVCAQVRIQIDQDVILAHDAFQGTLAIDNSDVQAISGIQVQLNFQNGTNGDASGMFIVEGPVLNGLTAVDGSGSVAPGTSGSAVYTFIPTDDAAPTEPTTYQIGGTLSYSNNGQQVTVPLLSTPITVYPEAKLDLLYFQQRDVYGDDPFTPQIEPSEPFPLGLIVKNVGAGTAYGFQITSGQPQIVDNEKGLLISFSILGTMVGDQPISPSLSATLGDIAPGGSKEVTWEMISSLQGHFLSFSATFQHVDDLGKTNTSLIQSVEIHSLVHQVQANRPGDDDLPDFLVNDIPNPDGLPDTLYMSDGSTTIIDVTTNATVKGSIGPGSLSVEVTAAVGGGWNYIQLPDPGVGYLLDHVVRSDGVSLMMTNDAWTTDRSFQGDAPEAIINYLLHIFDWAGSGTYTVYYRSTNTTPPSVVQLAGVTPFTQNNPVSSLNVTFSEPIDLSTFNFSSISLTRDGSPNLISADSGITVTAVASNTYSINGLQGLTAPTGNYQLTLNGAGIYDLWGNSAGNVSVSTQWAEGNAAVVVQSMDAVSPNPRNIPLASEGVLFSKPINSATLNPGALSLTLNGGANLITGAVTITSSSPTNVTINGLGALTAAPGNYTFTVNAAGIQDTTGVSGFGSQSVSWTMITTNPTITGLQPITTNPRNIVVPSLTVSFSEPVNPATFTYRNVSLTLNGGPNLITSAVTITNLNATNYQIGNINWLQGHPGTYSLTVNAAGIMDVAGNAGYGSTNETWQIILQGPPSPTNLVVAPGALLSPTNGVTATNTVMLYGTVAVSNLTVRIQDQGSSTDFGTAAVVGTNFSQLLQFTSQGQHTAKSVG